jgi:hypothetical protein
MCVPMICVFILVPDNWSSPRFRLREQERQRREQREQQREQQRMQERDGRVEEKGICVDDIKLF